MEARKERMTRSLSGLRSMHNESCRSAYKRISYMSKGKWKVGTFFSFFSLSSGLFERCHEWRDKLIATWTQ